MAAGEAFDYYTAPVAPMVLLMAAPEAANTLLSAGDEAPINWALPDLAIALISCMLDCAPTRPLALSLLLILAMGTLLGTSAKRFILKGWLLPPPDKLYGFLSMFTFSRAIYDANSCALVEAILGLGFLP